MVSETRPGITCIGLTQTLDVAASKALTCRSSSKTCLRHAQGAFRKVGSVGLWVCARSFFGLVVDKSLPPTAYQAHHIFALNSRAIDDASRPIDSPYLGLFRHSGVGV